MRFRQNHRPTPFLSRGDQHRMLAYCGMMMIVLVAMQMAADPDNWNWMFGGAGGEKHQPTLADLDLTPLEVADPTVREDGFEVPEADADASDADGAAVDGDAGNSTTAAGEEAASDDVALSAEFVAQIRDNTLGILRADGPAYWQALSNVDRLPIASFRAASEGPVRFPVLMSDPGAALGKVFTITGRLKRLQGWPVQENDVGITKLYEGWMTSPDSGNYLWRLLFTRLPEGVELGVEIDMPIAVTGYFFKRYGYQALESYRTAPMVIVAEMKLLPAPSKTQQQELARDMTTIALVFLGILVLGTGLLTWHFKRSDRRHAHSRAAQLAAHRNDAPPEDLQALQSAPVLNPDRPFDAPK